MKKKVLKELKNEMQINYLEKEGALIGYYRGYNISMGTLDTRYDISYISIPLKCPENLSIETISVFLNNLRSKYKGLSLARYENYRIVLNYTPKLRSKSKSEIFLLIINEVIDFCVLNNFVRCCEFCGESFDLSPVLINKVVASSCVNCKVELKNTLEVNRQAQREKSSNIIGGIVGSFLGAVIGSIIWIVVSQMGYIAALAGLAIAVCSIVGYEKFGGKLDVVGIIITSVITIFTVYLAQHISYAIDIYNTYKHQGFTFTTSLQSVPVFLENPKFARVFWGDLAKGYILTIAGSVSYIYKSYKERNYVVEVKDINI
jgi:hypothetical protein